MDLQESQMLLDAAELGRVLLAKNGEPRLEAFSGNALYCWRGMSTMNKYKTVKEVCDLTGLTRKHLYYFHHEKVVQAVAYAKGQDSGNANTDATFDTTLRTASSIEELETVVDAHVTECVQALWAEWEALSADLDTFDEYLASVDSIEAFHTHIEDSASQIFVMICDYSVAYAEMILQSDSSTKDMYDAFDDFKDHIYEDACEIVKDEIYEGLLNEIKDYYYDGIINDEKDSVEYSDWSDARGDAYSWWSDARGEVYSNWSDTRGDLYSFYSDMRSELYSGDTDGASDELQDFKDKVSKMKYRVGG